MSNNTKPFPEAAPERVGGNDNLLDLVRQLTSQGSHLAEQQLNLLQAEVREAATDVKVAIASMLGAAVAGIAGLGVVLMGLAYLLNQAIHNLGVATLIVGIATLAVAFVLYGSARRKMDAEHLSARRTRHTLERTPDALRGEL